MSDVRMLINGTFRVHDYAHCIGGSCPLHNPTRHHMIAWPIILRESGLMERQCEHGVGHPDPDSLRYVDPYGFYALGVHGCDGCCSRKKAKREVAL